MKSALTAWVNVAIAQARADLATWGFALPRAVFAFAEGVDPITAWPQRPEGMTQDQAEDWLLSQLVGGRARLADALRRTVTLPEGVRLITTYQDKLPEGFHAETAIGAHIVVSDPQRHCHVLRGVLPYVVRGPSPATPELLDLQLIEVHGAVPPAQAN